MLRSSSPAAARFWNHRASHALRCTALALTLGLAGHLAHAAGTSKATDAAPRANEIEWIDLSDYNYAQASSAAGQSFVIHLLDGRTLRFQLKYTTSGPSTYVPSVSPMSYAQASFGRTGYLGILGNPIIYGQASGTVEISNIQVSDTSGHLFAFEWVAADAESTSRGAAPAVGQEFLEFESNGSSWVQVASLPRTDGTPNDQTLQISGSPSLARIQQDNANPLGGSTNGGAYVLSTSNPSSIRFIYGNTAPPLGPQIEAAAFGIIPSPTIIGTMGSTTPASVPTNHPLLLLSIALALGWLAKRKFRTV